MNAKKPRRLRLLRLLAIFLVVLVGAAGAGYLYLNATETASAEETASDDAEAPDDAEGTAEANGAESEDAEAEDGEEGEEEEEVDRVPVNVAEVSLGSVSSYVSATANLVAENEVMVLAEAEGRLAELRVEEGDFVERGQVLAVLVRDDEQIAFDKADVRAANANLSFDRAKRLATQGMIPQEQLEQATMDHRLAQQELAEAKWVLQKTEIEAPFTGRLTTRNVTVGQHIRPGDELFVVTDFDPLVARIYLPEKDIVGLAEDRDVRITLQADEGVQFEGRIRQISPVVDIATGTVKLTIEAIQPPRAVRPGGFVTVDIVRETRDRAVLLPREAVIRELKRAHVFVAKDDIVVKRDIALGLEEGENVEVVSGLEAGEVVVVAGQGGLKDGDAIKVITDTEDDAVASDLEADSADVSG